MSDARLETVDALAQLTFLLQSTLERRAGEEDVSLVQARLLGILRDRRPTMAELARLLGLDKSSVSGLVDRAERRGLLERVASETDRRSFRVVLSPAGRDRVDAVAARFAADVRALLEPLSVGEEAVLAGLATRVLSAHADARGVDLFPPPG